MEPDGVKDLCDPHQESVVGEREGEPDHEQEDGGAAHGGREQRGQALSQRGAAAGLPAPLALGLRRDRAAPRHHAPLGGGKQGSGDPVRGPPVDAGHAGEDGHCVVVAALLVQPARGLVDETHGEGGNHEGWGAGDGEEDAPGRAQLAEEQPGDGHHE